MKTLFIEGKSKTSILEVIKKINKYDKIGILTTAQFLDQLKDIKKILKNAIIGGQVLGCDVTNAIKIKNKVDYFVYIGSGNFHPIQIALKTGKKVLIVNPNTNELSQVNQEEINDYKNKLKGKLAKFYNARKIGIIVSTKPGQNNLKKALEFKNKTNKESFIFLTDTLNQAELENFPDIEYWVNTACIRIEGNKIINLEDII